MKTNKTCPHCGAAMKIKTCKSDSEAGWVNVPDEMVYPHTNVKSIIGRTSYWCCDSRNRIHIDICPKCNEEMEHIIEEQSLYNYCKKCNITGAITQAPDPQPDENPFRGLYDDELFVLFSEGDAALTKYLLDNDRLTPEEKARFGLE